ncbi:hypothetical protein BC834DRAFT_873923 [Gloeopeniophorella convolvens]|nr:hypothetical protein BC834DRAFT_873923 [Gloeopeniophorella convolvens]
MFHPLAVSAVLVTGIISVSAQATSLSSQCQTTLAGLAASTEGECINAAGLIPLGLAGADTSLVAPIGAWLSGFCSKDPCSNQTLATFVTNITEGCSSDLAPLGISSDADASIIPSVQELYPLVRQIACLKDDNANQLCIVEELYDLQNATGTLSFNGIVSLIPKVLTGDTSFLPQNATCSSCNKVAYNIIATQSPQAIDSNSNSTVSKTCGADFLNGQQPSGISQTAAGLSLAQPASGNGAVPSIPLRDTLSFLAGLGVVFTALF